MNDNKNLNWINAAKGICMIAVFYVHSMLLCGPWIKYASPEIHAFYVNGFFFISGYLLFWKQLTAPKIEETYSLFPQRGGKSLFNNIIFRIVIPSILFAMLFYFPAKIVKHEEISIVDFLLETVGGRTFWFTSALAVAEIIILLLLFARRKNIWFYIICLAIFVLFGFIAASNNPETYALDIWAWRRGLLCLIFLGLGGLYWRYETWIDKYLFNWVSFVVLFVVMEIFLYCLDAKDCLLIGTLNIKPIGIIPGLISVLLLIKLCKIIPENNVLTFIGQNSLGFFFLCSGVPLLLSVMFHKYIDGAPIYGPFLVCMLGLVISYLVVYLLNRWFPWVFDLRKLKRNK